MMKNKSSKIVISFLLMISTLLSLLFFSMFNGNFENVYTKAASRSYLNTVSNSDSNLIYSDISFKGEDNDKFLSNTFLSLYMRSFLTKSNKVIAIKNQGEYASFKTYFDGNELPFDTKAVSGEYYTNDFEKMTFETVNINLYKKRSRELELSFDSNIYDSVIYIPDFYADYIIDNSSDLSSYDDLIENNLNKVFKFVTNKKTYRCKISNIFHVDGFNNKYSSEIIEYTDNQNGLNLKSLLGGYCFLTNAKTVLEENEGLSFSLINIMENRSILFDDYVETINKKVNNAENMEINSSFMYLKNGEIIFHELSDKIFHYTSQILFDYNFYLFILFTGIALILSFVLMLKRFDFRCSSLMFLLNICACTFFMFIDFLLKKIIPIFAIFKFFNVNTLGLCCFYFIVSIFLILYKKNIQNGNKYE